MRHRGFVGEEHGAEHEEPFYRSLRGILTTTHHTNIGIMYISLALINLLLAGISAFLIRLQLSGIGVTDPGRYLAIVTLHGTMMIFFVVMPFFAGIGNYILPKMVGAPDLYWPKINALGFWMFASSSALIWLTLLDAENLQIGWTGYAPLSEASRLFCGSLGSEPLPSGYILYTGCCELLPNSYEA